MNVNDITTLIGSLGFPIFCTIVLFKQNGELQKTLSDISVTMQSLAERLADIEHKVGGNADDGK